MKTKTKTLILLICVLPVLIAGLLLYYAHRNQGRFTGNCIRNADEYLLDAEWMDSSDEHTLQLRQGEILRIHFETEAGSLFLRILSPDGTELYSGNGAEVSDFTVNVPKDGNYRVSVVGRKAKGSIHITGEMP